VVTHVYLVLGEGVRKEGSCTHEGCTKLAQREKGARGLLLCYTHGGGYDVSTRSAPVSCVVVGYHSVEHTGEDRDVCHNVRTWEAAMRLLNTTRTSAWIMVSFLDMLSAITDSAHNHQCWSQVEVEGLSFCRAHRTNKTCTHTHCNQPPVHEKTGFCSRHIPSLNARKQALHKPHNCARAGRA
jgi:hypothetical protein